MNSFKRILKLILLVFLILLVGLGIGLTGGIPLPPTGNRKDKTEVSIERLDEASENEEKVSFNQVK